MQLEWELTENKKFDEKIDELTGSHIISQILANRGLDTFEKAEIFLNPKKFPISSPDNFLDIDKAVNRIKDSIKKSENIVICGDFDCDGVTSTAVLYKTLIKVGAKVGCYIPNRLNENHGLNSKAIIEIISKQKAKLIITVDNGISNVTEIKLAQSLGTDVIVTDHHEPADILPPAFAIINPKCSDKISSKLEFSEIQNMVNFAGVMVAFKLCTKLLEEFNKSDYVDELIPYVMLGTISDVMPLVMENRCIVCKGLELISNDMPRWLKKLLELAGRNQEKLSSETMAFIVAPRINAAGRLEHATTALELLVSDDEEKINFCANQLNQFNQTRQQMCDTSFFEAASRIQDEINLKTTKSIVLADEKWHIGIVGLLASKIVETYNRPAFIMAIDKEENKARCSIRGIKGLNIYKVLSQMEDCFENYGGHELAGGFEADLSKHSINEIANRINKIVLNELEGNSLKRKIFVDAILKSDDLSVDFIEKLSMLEPFGEGNRSCTFGMENLVLKKFSTIGNDSHLKFLFETEDKKTTYDALIWNKNSHDIDVLDIADLTFVPQINEYKGQKNIQLILKNIYIKNREIEKSNNDFDENAKAQTLLVDHRKKKDYLKMLNSYVKKNKAAVFVENKEILTKLSDYNELKALSNNRFNLFNAQEVILLSAPSCEEDFAKIISDTMAEKIHIFNSNDPKIEINDFIKTISGMLKYCYSHNNGAIEIEKSLAYLSCTKEAFDIAISLLNDIGVVEIQKAEKKEYSFKFIESKPLSEFLHSEKYELLSQEIEKINSFREEFLSGDFVQIKELLSV